MSADRAVGGGGARPFGLFERVIAGRYLRAKRAQGGVALISIISFLGIMAAVMVLIVVMSVMNGFRHDLLDRLLGAQGHVFIHSVFDNGEQTRALAARLEDEPGVVSATPVVNGQAGVMTQYAFSGVYIYGLEREDMLSQELVSAGIVYGSLDDFGVGDRGGDTIVIGSLLANRLGVGVGDPVSLVSPSTASTVFGASFRRKTYYVGAVFSVGMSQIDDLFVYLPIEQARIFLGRGTERYADVIEVFVENPDDADAARAQVRELVGPTVLLTDWRDNHGSYVNALNVERNVMRLILGLLVLIAALNIISGLVMLTKNKGGDIAILRTMGATRGAIMRIFIMIGAAIGVLGTITGLGLGVLFCLNIGAIQAAVEFVTQTEVFSAEVYFLSGIPARVEWSEVTMIALWGFALSCLATLPPAWNAARLDPVEALRYE